MRNKERRRWSGDKKKKEDFRSKLLHARAHIYTELWRTTPYIGEWSDTSPINSRGMKQNEEESKTEEYRRIVLEVLDEERVLDYYSDYESESYYDYQTNI